MQELHVIVGVLLEKKLSATVMAEHGGEEAGPCKTTAAPQVQENCMAEQWRASAEHNDAATAPGQSCEEPAGMMPCWMTFDCGMTLCDGDTAVGNTHSRNPKPHRILLRGRMHKNSAAGSIRRVGDDCAVTSDIQQDLRSESSGHRCSSGKDGASETAAFREILLSCGHQIPGVLFDEHGSGVVVVASVSRRRDEISPGDIVRTLDGIRVTSTKQLERLLRATNLSHRCQPRLLELVRHGEDKIR